MDSESPQGVYSRGNLRIKTVEYAAKAATDKVKHLSQKKIKLFPQNADKVIMSAKESEMKQQASWTTAFAKANPEAMRAASEKAAKIRELRAQKNNL